tara:strand:+ start:413 stop:1504 length:1092 start_codon:yes stop_codon:yes gene_type:complete
MRALVIGGTGPTGPSVVRGLLDRGFEVAIYHRGTHETPELPEVHEHLHGNPDDLEALNDDFGNTSWDIVVSMYGRLRLIAEVMAGRCERFIAIGGKGGNVPPSLLPFPEGRGFPRDETHPRFEDRELNNVGWAVAQTERDVFARQDAGEFQATVLRYTDLYGPRVPRQWIWPLVRRVLDGRTRVILPNGGQQLRPACYIENAAQQVMAIVDNEDSIGHSYHAVDTQAICLSDVVRLVAEELDHEWEPVSITHPLADQLATGYATPSEQFDTASLRALGYQDAVEPAIAIRYTARWLVEHRDEFDEAQVNALIPNPYAYEAEDRLIDAHQSWSENVTEDIPAPEISSALGPGFRAGYGPTTNRP